MIFSALKILFQDTGNHPPRFNSTFQPSGMDIDDARELLDIKPLDYDEFYADVAERKGEANAVVKTATKPGRIEEDLNGVTFGIEYCDSKGNESLRRITIRDFYQSEAGTYYIQAVCHERNAVRNFRLDRILSIHDMDGVVYEPLEFFRDELLLDLDEVRVNEAPRPKTHPGTIQRRNAKNGIRVLTALARCDGMLHPAEVDVIIEYVAKKCANEGIDMNEKDATALEGYVKRLKPDESDVFCALDELEYEAPEYQQLFIDKAVKLANADGILDGSEFDLLMEIKEQIGN